MKHEKLLRSYGFTPTQYKFFKRILVRIISVAKTELPFEVFIDCEGKCNSDLTLCFFYLKFSFI
jgi:hypothetical protein